MSQTTISPEAGSSTTDRLASMAQETATRAADGAKLMQEHAVAAAEENLRKVRSYAESSPLVTAGIAFAAGALLTALIRR